MPSRMKSKSKKSANTVQRDKKKRPPVDASILQHNLESDANQHLQVQTGSCRSSQYKQYDKCRSCLDQLVKDCRFKQFRAFADDDTEGASLHFVSFSGEDGLQQAKRPKITKKEQHRKYAIKTIRGAVAKILEDEDAEVQRWGGKVRRRTPQVNERHICDGCQTTIFNFHYMCAMCGVDLCTACHEKLDDTKSRLTSCSYRRIHTKDHMIPVIKYKNETLQTIQEQCDMEIDDDDDDASSSPPQHATSSGDVFRIPVDQLDLKTFQFHWQQNKPIVVENVMSSSQVPWTPEYFSKNYGSWKTQVINCDTGDISEMTIRKFFKGFSDYKKRPGYVKRLDNKVTLKIKDWPPKEYFKDSFPELYNDFMRILPAPEYCAVDGYLNLSNRLPDTYLPPDLGPKMFIAYGAVDGTQKVGTTKLHCDMADAVNVMCYADKPDDEPAAVWDIFPYESLPKLKEFVNKIAKEEDVEIRRDPIHDQWLYLNDGLLARLEREYGVKSWRIYQNPGDAIFIPAGCAHQVFNYHSAIKCAYDFLSPEHLDRCMDLTQQFSDISKEDALQLKNTLVFAWSDLFEAHASSPSPSSPLSPLSPLSSLFRLSPLSSLSSLSPSSPSSPSPSSSSSH